MLTREGISVAVVDAYCIKPLGVDVSRSVAEKTNHTIITVEDHYVEGGLGDAVAGELSAEGFRVHKLGVRESPHSGKSEELLARYGIDAEAISKEARGLPA